MKEPTYISQVNNRTDVATVLNNLAIRTEEQDSIDSDLSHSIKPTIFSISISFFLIACSLGLAIWGFVIFTKNKDVYKQQQQEYYASRQKEWNVELSGMTNSIMEQSTCNQTRTELLETMFNRDVLVVALSDLFATCLSIGSVIILLIQLVITSRRMFNEDDDDESFYDKLNMEKENNMVLGGARISVDASSANKPTTLEGVDGITNNSSRSILQRQSVMTTNYKIKEKSLWTKMEKDHNLLFIISSCLTVSRVVTGIISLSFTITLSTELSNGCISDIINGITSFDSILPFMYTQFGIIILVCLVIPVNQFILYFWLKKNSRVYRLVAGLSRRFEKDEDN